MKILTFLLLVVLAIGVSGLYGAVHDQISCSVSSEYFTKFKYHQFGVADKDAPLRLNAASIGVRATWWMGIPIGLVVGAVGLIHPTARLMFGRTCWAFAAVAAVALAFGIWGLGKGWFMASHDPVDYTGWFIPSDLENPRNFLAVGHMHNHSYLGGTVGIFVGIACQVFLRIRRTI